MRYPPEQKAKTRQTILDAAARVFRRQGYQGGGVDAVMKEAGLTHGGFYAHFPNKEALLAEAVREGLEGMRDQHQNWTAGLDGAAWIQAFVGGYLSQGHREHTEDGCPAPALVSELGRLGDNPKRSFEKALVGWAEEIEPHLEGVPEEDRDEIALGAIAACVGGLALSRAVSSSELAERLLSGARDLVLRAVTESHQTNHDVRQGDSQENDR